VFRFIADFITCYRGSLCSYKRSHSASVTVWRIAS